MKPGDKVRLTEAYKQMLISNDCADHVEEFGDCVGIVEEPIENSWPEFNVRWQPSQLRYGYHPDHLEFIEEES